MSKYEIEIDDDQIHDVIYALTTAGLAGTIGSGIADQLELQAPIPAPTKRLAVVRAEDGISVLVDPSDDMSWVTYPRYGGGYDWNETPGKIVEVLFEGYGGW